MINTKGKIFFFFFSFNDSYWDIESAGVESNTSYFKQENLLAVSPREGLTSGPGDC